jgi:leucyl aminopeptidase (aminopeptidase T)
MRFAAYLLDAVGARAGERLAIVADADRAAAAAATAEAARERGLGVELVTTTEDYRREADMPAPAIAAVDAADDALLHGDIPRIQFGGHSEYRRRATARGARVGYVTYDLREVDGEALRRVAEDTRRLAGLLGEASSARLTTTAGTELELALGDRPGTALTNELALPGGWGALPDFFEAAVAPLEERTEGLVLVDGMSLVTGIADEPIQQRVEAGRVIDVRGGAAEALRAYLAASGADADVVCELGVGTNDVASPLLIGGFVDKRIAGTAHLGLGDNLGLGGASHAATHTDVLVRDAVLELDGRVVVAGGGLRLPEPYRPSSASRSR